MASLELINVSKKYTQDTEAVKGISLSIEDTEFVVFVGPSGCGKSTTLRMIAGLETVTGGTIEIDGKPVNDIPSKDRDLAMVFQNYALYPHMSVFDNMAFGLKMRKVPKIEINRRVNEAAKTLGLEKMLERRPGALSGGERQRVAMGRAIVRAPKIFLMDEPLSNLDAKLRIQMREEIADLHRRLNTTFIYVTHDQMEAMTLGKKIVVMKDGIIMQADTPMNLYSHPDNVFVAGFIGTYPMNFLKGFVECDGNNYINIEGLCRLPVELTADFPGEPITLGLRPEHLYAQGGEGRFRLMDGLIEHMEVYGSETILHVKRNATTIKVRTDYSHDYRIGSAIVIYGNKHQVHFFDSNENAVAEDTIKILA
ncbi:MAG: sn-glycerol-3-phosphate ABC transporter ATP-binding protein UgpC [Lachnospiraceae bacterium]|nr:sn-glycerol-3-phosphate ABC transporter ATP-binding protein UgpC [Lachnospiraceae bacterium]